MKGLIKFIPVALAAVALASCSNDDFLSSEGEYTPSENAIALYLDNGTTRTGIQETAEGNHFVWTKGDIIKLYGVNQVKTNKYKVTAAYQAATAEYNKSGLLGYAELQGTDNIGSDLAFAMYPGTDENFFNSEYFNQFEMQLPAKWTYDVMGDNDDVFYADFPMWGVANADNSAVTFKYTTAFLRLDLSGLSASANAAIYITADKQLNGRFTGTISDIDGSNKVDLPALEPADPFVEKGVAEIISGTTLDGVYNPATGLYDNFAGLTTAEVAGFALQQVKINLKNLSNNDKRIIYLPIPVQNYGKLNIVLNYPEENRTDVIFDKALDLTAENRGIGWFGNMKRAFSVTDQFYYPSDINQELFDNRSNTNDLNYKSDVVMTVDDGAGTLKEGGNTILMPKMTASNVILNFIYETATAIKKTNASDKLYIKDRVASEPFTGTLTINTKSIDVNSLEINLPKANVILIGGDATYGQFGNVNVTAAKSITVGDNTTTTTQKASTQLVIKETDENDGCQVNVLGAATFNKIYLYQENAKLSVGGVKDAATNDYYAGGTVTTVEISKNKPEVVLQGNGSISFLSSTYVPSATAKAAGTVKSYGASYIKTVSVGEPNLEFESTWDGVSKTAAAAVVGNNVYTAAQLASFLGDATGAVTINLKTDVDLQNKFWAGINAGSYAFNITGTDSHFGTSSNKLAGIKAIHTISNLNLSGETGTTATGLAKVIADNDTDTDASNIGLVKQADAVTVANLIIQNASCALSKYDETAHSSSHADYKFVANNIGALVGQATSATINGLTVSLAGTQFGYTVANKAANIGGVIGNLDQGTTATTITKTTVSATGKINGYHSLGGIIGGVTATAGTITINGTGDNACSVTLGGFTQNYNNGKTIDKNIGRVGGFIGSAGTLTGSGVYYNGTISNTITMAGSVSTAWPDMSRNKIIQGTAPDFDYLTYTRNNDHIGYCGDETTPGKIVIGPTTRTTPLTKPSAANQPKALYWFE
jgi:hypothetical protein